jgi:hypothetical protein
MPLTLHKSDEAPDTDVSAESWHILSVSGALFIEEHRVRRHRLVAAATGTPAARSAAVATFCELLRAHVTRRRERLGLTLLDVEDSLHISTSFH